MATSIVNSIRIMTVLIAIIMLTSWFNSEKGPVITFLIAIGLICLTPLGYYLELVYLGGYRDDRDNRQRRLQTKLRSRRQD